MQRPQRRLDGKAGEERQEYPDLHRRVHRAIAERRGQFGDGKRHSPRGRLWGRMIVDPKHDGQQTEERQHTAGKCEEEEFHRRPAPLPASPDADQEKERDQRELEENVEKDDVAGDENAQHPGLQGHQQAVIQRRLFLDRFPADQHRHDHQQRGQGEQP